VLKSGRFLGQSGLRIRLGGKGLVAIDPKATFGACQMQLRRMRHCGAA
jgi:hypothetical protein